ncbi:Bug family tripartite tricarboxylate transporter substrate binding protein [Piscinibacter koreensis]|uniref:Tripartite tricarboxylate transporter substrate binding protein n=1 Tax=Piscinibacter koreensis TaxID=2742824 RepID=A0A7Y6TV65_9BURK|nr:tripartite tricarboxylate transporter substrate binding protein [Schlegelella koreensis]NUZ04607.1 tripartite tricarboxylate transporter substrate binding protein [Schlegelella koreensis]
MPPTHPPRRRFGASIASLLAAGALPPSLLAQTREAGTYPSRPVKVVLPFAPGSVTDLITRILADRLSQRLGQPFVVDNKAGGNGTIGAGAVAHAAPDGYTILFTTNTTHSIIEALLKQVPYDPQKDFTPIARLAGIPSLVVANPALPIASIEQFVAYAKANPGKLRYGFGNSSGQIGGATLERELGIRMVAVPYKGNPQAAQDVMAGHLEAMIADVATAQPFVKAGRLRALAVLTDKRLTLMPDVPTLAETVSPGFDVIAWFGAFGPAHMPTQALDVLARELNLAVQDPGIDAQLRGNGIAPGFVGPAAFGPLLHRERARWMALARSAGIEPQ